MKVLVVGAGALGCELLTKLALYHFHDIEIVDADTIEISNVSRQLLFRREHVGRAKATVAALCMQRSHPHLRIQAHVKSIEECSFAYFGQFSLAFCAVDNVTTRLWLGSVCQQAGLPLIEAGTEACLGHVRLVIPGKTPCLYCTRALFSHEEDTLPICTLSGRPTRPEHCLGWALSIEWPRLSKEEFDLSKVEHVRLLTDLARKRAQEFHIAIPEDYAIKALQRILPALVSTSSVVSGICLLVANRLILNQEIKDNYWMVNLSAGFYFNSFPLDKDPECPFCN